MLLRLRIVFAISAARDLGGALCLVFWKGRLSWAGGNLA